MSIPVAVKERDSEEEPSTYQGYMEIVILANPGGVNLNDFFLPAHHCAERIVTQIHSNDYFHHLWSLGAPPPTIF